MNQRLLARIEIFIIIILASIPLFVTFPYRVNIFLSWEGAFRISEGQLPFRDFGTPLGGAYWVIPAIFFKIFGSKLITLVKAQVLINMIAGLSFRSILSSLSVKSGIRLISVLLFCISYSFFNFWPWYNHSVIVFEITAIAFLLKYIFSNSHYRWLLLLLSAFFVCFSFMTKQDGGSMAFFISAILLTYHCFTEKKILPIVLFTVFFLIFTFLYVFPFLKYGFGYWFNHGQPPHNARLSLFDITDEFFGSSIWIKFYFFIITLLPFVVYKKMKELYASKSNMLFFILTILILGEAAIFQVTSYTPPDNNIFFHSFAIAFIANILSFVWPIHINNPRIILLAAIGIMFWWSGVYWKYMQRIAVRLLDDTEETVSATGENIVNKKTYLINTDTADIPMNKWVESGLESFDHIYMPRQTADGIHRLLDLDLIKQRRNLKILNMSELTPLAAEIPYSLERNSELPLWFHLGVGMFNHEAGIYEKRIQDHYYDLVLFEYIPNLNNFYPFRIRDSLKTEYHLIDSFMAPRRGDTKGTIEVYIKP